jgi:Retroviral aspartyl protease
MPIYDDHFFNPPAPLARVTLRNAGDGKTVSDVPMLIDSGADVTLIPHQSVTLLGAFIASDTSYEVMGFDGRKSTAQVVSLDLIFLRRTFRGRFLVGTQEWGIVGRDVLNHVSVLLDGPRLVWDEQRSSGR